MLLGNDDFWRHAERAAARQQRDVGKALISTLAAHASRTWKDDDSVDSTAVPTSDSPPDASTFQRGLSSQLATEVARMSTTELAIWIVSELADGLAHAHQRGVLHRDIKPANVLLSDDGLPMLLDFNLAASTRPDDRSHQVVGGTLRYMSPEQLRAVQNQRSTLDAARTCSAWASYSTSCSCARAPFVDRTGSWNEVLQQMLHDRQMLPTSISTGARESRRRCRVFCSARWPLIPTCATNPLPSFAMTCGRTFKHAHCRPQKFDRFANGFASGTLAIHACRR